MVRRFLRPRSSPLAVGSSSTNLWGTGASPQPRPTIEGIRPLFVAHRDRACRQTSTGSPPLVSSSSEPRLSDGELVRRALVGDEEAFAEIVARYQRAAWLVAFGITRQREDAEDVTQEAFLVALQRLEACRNPDSFAGWFMTIVRNRALNHLRRERRRETEPIPFQAPSPAPGPEAIALRGSLRDQLAEALSELTPIQREVVLLHDLEGWKHREIAERTGVPAGTVRSHLHFARKRLRSLLGSLDGISPKGEVS